MNSEVNLAETDSADSTGRQGPNGLTALERVMIAIVVITLGAGCLLISAAEGEEAGHQPWKPGSMLRIVAELMALNYEYPTPRGVEIKWLIQSLGAASALLAGVVAWYVRAKRREEEFLLSETPSIGGTIGSVNKFFSSISLDTGAQIALFLFACWSMLSAWWSPWAEASFGEGLRQLIVTVWAIALGQTLGRKGARPAAWAMVIVLVITAAVGIWYHMERNPYQRLKFPIGNPIFLAACLLPGILLCLATIAGEFQYVFRGYTGSFSCDRDQSNTNDSWYPRWVVLGAIIGLVILYWAFRLSASRGPLVGLMAGLAMSVYLLLTKRSRWVFVIILLVAIVAGVFWFQSQLSVLEGGRGATIRLRMHTMQYAVNLFLDSPVVGHGQGSYVLLAHPLSLADAMNDPIAFPAPVVGHAHNEWLEILADLGAVGFALMAIGLVLTFVSARKALLRMKDPADRWCTIGLLAALVAIVVEETGDVALRMAGLPVVFYGLIGIIWGMSREPDSGTAPVSRPPGRVVRVVALIAAIAAAGGIAHVAVRDWQGALADPVIVEHVENRQWDEAFHKAHIASSSRLDLANLLLGSFQEVQLAYQAGAYRVKQMRKAAGRLSEPGIDRMQLIQITRADAEQARQYFDLCEIKGTQLLYRMNGYPHVAGIIADVYLRRHELDSFEKELGLRDRVRSFIPAAAEWMELEYARNRLDVKNALRLFNLSDGQAIQYRLDLLRVPLRSGPFLRELEMALTKLIQQPGFEEAIDNLLARAAAAMAAPADVLWSDHPQMYDPYAPETYRLSAMTYRITGRFDEAVAMADKAVEVSGRISGNFPSAVSYALSDKAGYLLYSRPGQADLAVDACRQAIDNWPPFGDRELQLAPLRKDLSIYLLAAGRESEAHELIRSLIERVSPGQAGRNVGYGYFELCRQFVLFVPDKRPKAFNDWLQRSLELVPDLAPARLLAVRAALEQNDDAATKEHLSILESLVEDPREIVQALRKLLSVFGDNRVLRSYLEDFIKRRSSPTQPATNPNN
ncbi:MAG: O-antigen ligase family protein [Planctomycetota bacterium]